MLDLQNIRAFYPGFPESPDTDIQLYKEYLELMVLDYLSSHSQIGKLTFIGGTALRLLRQIDRFSEDLDFDCKHLSQEEFASLTDDVVRFLRRNGLPAVAKEKESDALTAFRRTIQFPQLLYDLGLSPYREKKFVLKIEAQDQGVDYQRDMFTVNRDGFPSQSTGFQVLAVSYGKLLPHFGFPCSVGMNGCKQKLILAELYTKKYSESMLHSQRSRVI